MGRLFSIALCAAAVLAPAASAAAPGSDATIRATPFNLVGKANNGAQVQCPDGTLATGGGVGPNNADFNRSGNDYTLQTSNAQDENGTTPATSDKNLPHFWYGDIYLNKTESQSFKTFALCSPSADSVLAVVAQTVPAQSSASEDATCPAGMRVTGGGVGANVTNISQQSAVQYRVQVSAPVDETGDVAQTDDGDVARGWHSSFFNKATTSGQFKTMAVCSAGSDATVATNTFVAGQTGSDSAVASCPAGQRALGGGVGYTPDFVGGSFSHTTQFSGPVDETGTMAATDTGDVARGWLGSAWNVSTTNLKTFKVFALCSPDPTDGGDGGGGGGGGGGGTTDTVAPRFARALRMMRAVFRVGSATTPVVARVGVGTAFLFALSEPSTVRVAIYKLVTGRKVGHSCLRPRFSNRGRPRCTRRLGVGRLTRRNLAAGARRIPFSGRIGRRKLAPGRYAAVAQATDGAGNKSATKTVGFTIVR